MKETIKTLPEVPGYQSVDLSSEAMAVGPNRSMQTDANVGVPTYIKAGANILKLSRLGKQADPEDSRFEDIFEVENLSSADDEARIIVTGQTVVGRETTPELQLDKTASRSHLEITPMANAVLVSDLDSTNGTVVQAPSFKTDYTLFNQPVHPPRN